MRNAGHIIVARKAAGRDAILDSMCYVCKGALRRSPSSSFQKACMLLGSQRGWNLVTATPQHVHAGIVSYRLIKQCVQYGLPSPGCAQCREHGLPRCLEAKQLAAGWLPACGGTDGGLQRL